MKGNRKKLIGTYTLLFAMLAGVMFLPFLITGKSLIWNVDGLPQYYPYLRYMGNWLRDTLRSMFRGELSVRLYDLRIGMGDDIGAVFRSHPLDLLSVLVPAEQTEWLYNGLVILRLYLAGLCFLAFCRYWNRPDPAILTGSLVYLSSGYVLRLGTQHPTFLTAMIMLPLLLLGAEKVLRKESVLPFAAASALGFVSNYYFMFMCSIVMACYVLLRFPELYHKDRVREFFRMGVRLVLAYLLGLGMVAAVLLPVILRLVDSPRLAAGTDSGSLLLYEDTRRYYAWLTDLISPYRNTGSNTQLNYSPLVLPALAVLFFEKRKTEKKQGKLKLAVLTELAVLLVPAGGYVMAACSNVNNRWTFVAGFTLSLVVVWKEEELLRPDRHQRRGIVLFWLVVTVVTVYDYACGRGGIFGLAGWGMLTVCLGVLLLNGIRKKGTGKRNIILPLLVILCSAVSGTVTFMPEYGGSLAEYTDRNVIEHAYLESAPAQFRQITADGFYRVDTDEISSGMENSSLMLDYYGVSQYNSVLSADWLQYLLDQENTGANALHRVFGMDGRTVPDALANVAFFMTRNETGQGVPYGYALDEQASGNLDRIYRNEYPLSFGYTYRSIMDRETYEQLSPLQKQQIMLEAVIVEGAADGYAMENLRDTTDRILTLQVELPEKGKKISATDAGYRVKEAGGSISIPAEKRKGYERYLRLIGLNREKEYSFVDISTQELVKTVTVRGTEQTYSLGRSNYLVNLGYDDQDGEDQITVAFREKGNYDLAALEICYVPMEGYEEKVAELNEEAMTDVQISGNEIRGSIAVSDEKMLVLSVPYQKGWTAWIDGEKAEPERVNIMYTGLLIEPGEHEIIFRYCSTGFKAGLGISALSLIVFFTLLFAEGKKRRV